MQTVHMICWFIVGSVLGVTFARARTTGEAVVALIGIMACVGAGSK